jgi:hypothetical protein
LNRTMKTTAIRPVFRNWLAVTPSSRTTELPRGRLGPVL